MVPADTVHPVSTAEDGRAFSGTTDQILITARLNPQEVDMSGFLKFAWRAAAGPAQAGTMPSARGGRNWSEVAMKKLWSVSVRRRVRQ